jgi:formylglycine-generating enzyme required for sulfatase activity
VDQKLEHLKRQLEADPKNSRLQCALLSARARIYGSSVYLEPLEDRLIWNQCSEPIQDMAIGEIRRRLGSSYEWLETAVYSCNHQSHRIASFEHIKSGLQLNLLPGGEYIMGDDSTNYLGLRLRAHRVKIEPLLIGCYPVTQAQWKTITGRNPSHFKGLDRPVEMVSWMDIQKWLEKVGDGLRLPSESEWEYACRGSGHPPGTTTQYFWGDEMDGSYCWFSDNSQNQTHPVSLHKDKTNAFGLVDMIGNVFEWCQDVWIDNYRDGPYDSLPRTGGGSNRVYRSSDWASGASESSSVIRHPYTRSNSFYRIGWRVSRTCPAE